MVSALEDDPQTLLVYTDGSAMPNPGRVGYGVVLMNNGQQREISQAVGIGSNVTGELCGLQRALQEVLATAGKFTRTFIFCDCLAAVDLALSNTEPRFHFDLVRDIRLLVAEIRTRTSLTIQWVPAHVGVPGNEGANDAAKRAAASISAKSPIPGQPKIPMAIAKAILVQGQRERWSRRWITSAAQKFEFDHLSRLKPSVAKTDSFFVGTRREQSVLARLRLGHCALAASRARWSPVDRICECGIEDETVGHFLLRCPRHARSRARLFQRISDVYEGFVNEEVLLGTAPVRMNRDEWRFISAAVYQYVRETKKDI